MKTTKRERGRRLDSIAKVLEQQTDGDDDWSVEYRTAAPSERPDGMSVETDGQVIRYDFWEAQEECIERLADGAHDIVAFLAGYGAGKTIVGARWLLTQALAHPGSHFLCMGINYSRAQGTTYEALFEQLPGGDQTTTLTEGFNGPEQSPIVADYNRNNKRLTLSNASVITLGSADKWSRHAGAEFGAIWLDEPSHYGSDLHDLLEMLGSRLRGAAGPQNQLWTLTGNGYNAAWEVLDEQQDSNGEPLGLNIDVVRAYSLSNPYLSSAEKERFERQYAGSSREEQALYGGFAAAQGLTYPMFSRDRHVVGHSEAVDRLAGTWRVYAHDPGYTDPRGVLEIGRTDSGQYIVLDEFYRTGTNVDAAIRWVAGRPDGTVFSDHDPGEQREMRQAGLGAQNAKKDLDAGVAAVRRSFDIDPDSDQPGVLISDRCEHLIQELLSYQEDEIGSAVAVDHLCDCLRYAIYSEDSKATIRRGTPSKIREMVADDPNITRRTPGSASKKNIISGNSGDPFEDDSSLKRIR